MARNLHDQQRLPAASDGLLVGGSVRGGRIRHAAIRFAKNEFQTRHFELTPMLRKQLLDSSRGRIVTLLREGGLTAEDLASRLGLTRSAIRAQMSAMERDGVVRRAGQRPGTTRPSLVFELTPEVEQLLSSAYIPLLTQLVDVFTESVPADQLEAMLRQTGRRVADELTQGRKPSGDLPARIATASALMNEQLGATTRVEGNGKYVIRSGACPLAALTGKHPGVCLAMESFVAEVVGAPVHECCDRAERPQCCFEIPASGHTRRPSRTRGTASLKPVR